MAQLTLWRESQRRAICEAGYGRFASTKSSRLWSATAVDVGRHGLRAVKCRGGGELRNRSGLPLEL